MRAVHQIKYNRSNRGGTPIKYIVVHDTGNPSRGANATAHYNYFNGGSWAQWCEFKEKLSESEDLTMAQYEELKNEITQLTETVKILATELCDIKHPMIYNYIDDNMPEWAREAVARAVKHGILKGDENGLNLDDKDLRYITMVYRMRKWKAA